jgi:hypothetical protein
MAARELPKLPLVNLKSLNWRRLTCSTTKCSGVTEMLARLRASGQNWLYFSTGPNHRCTIDQDGRRF